MRTPRRFALAVGIAASVVACASDTVDPNQLQRWSEGGREYAKKGGITCVAVARVTINGRLYFIWSRIDKGGTPVDVCPFDANEPDGGARGEFVMPATIQMLAHEVPQLSSEMFRSFKTVLGVVFENAEMVRC